MAIALQSLLRLDRRIEYRKKPKKILAGTIFFLKNVLSICR